MQHDYACAPGGNQCRECGHYAFVGDNPIGMAHTSYGRFTSVNDAHSDAVYKIDNASHTVVGDRSAPRRRYAS
jgi:hypothetical protein